MFPPPVHLVSVRLAVLFSQSPPPSFVAELFGMVVPVKVAEPALMKAPPPSCPAVFPLRVEKPIVRARPVS